MVRSLKLKGSKALLASTLQSTSTFSVCCITFTRSECTHTEMFNIDCNGDTRLKCGIPFNYFFLNQWSFELGKNYVLQFCYFFLSYPVMLNKMHLSYKHTHKGG